MHLSKSLLCVLAFAAFTAHAFAADNPLPHYDHVVVVIEENHSLSQVAESTYLGWLASQGTLFTQSFAVAHPSQPNYIALFSGSTHGIRNDWRHDLSAPNLALSLQSAGLTFTGYSEDLPAVGFRGERAGEYVRKHAPWASFTNVPDAVNQPFTEFPTSNFSSLPTVSFVIPNLQDDMHDGSVAQCDSWLQEHMDGYARWAESHHSLLIVTFDEGPGSQAPEKTPIATIIVGAHVKVGISDQPITHYSILRLVEDIYGLPYIAEDGSAPRISGIWD
jgi:phosphatidylinositol-3-phosphatase